MRQRRFRRTGLFALLLLTLTLLIARPDRSLADGPPLTYEADILPLFEKHCVRCHGPDTAEAGLRLDEPRWLLRGGESGPVIVPRKSASSHLWELIRAGEMPPEPEDRLSAAAVASIREWIDGGARFAAPIEPLSVRFHDVLPILLLRCVPCHGAQRQEGELDLRDYPSILRGGKSGPALIAGQPADSRLLQRIHAGDMPPKLRLVESSSKPIEPLEVQRIEQWISQGAPAPEDIVAPGGDSSAAQTGPTFWAFQTPLKPPLPSPEASDTVGELTGPIDRFVRARLHDHQLDLSPPATPLVLLRRAYFDLTGLPPTREQTQRFLDRAAEDAELAYSELVDDLLASPRYGERWGRYWLDVAGYSDSEGVQHSDSVRANAWRYRDYVIRSFNSDKPYDRFLMEQLAGDELADYRDHAAVTPEIYDNLVATGFLRMAPDGTWANITNFVPDRLDVIGDELEILTSSVMGLTFKCARCHSHKFDPITQRNYYGLAAIFKGAYDEHDWLKPYSATTFSSGPFGSRQLPFVTTEEWSAWKANEAEIDRQLADLNARLGEVTSLADEAERKSQHEQLERQVKEWEGKRVPQPLVRALWDRGSPTPTYLLQRGNYLTSGSLVAPHVPEFLSTRQPFAIAPPPAGESTGRRLALARWLTQPDHPLTARVLVNRIWQHHFGRGIVATADNFGTTGSPPSHPLLLDWLATDFVEHGWRIKRLQRMIMLSATYRQRSQVTQQHLDRDPDNRLLARMPLRRLDAEALRDSLLAVSGRLNLRPYGPPDAVAAREDGLVTVVAADGGWRRSVYALQRRTQIPTLLENFDLPAMGPNCLDRPVSTVAPQALQLLNSELVHELAASFSRQVLAATTAATTETAAETVAAESEVAEETEVRRIVEEIYWRALTRAPTDRELQLAEHQIERLQELWRAELSELPAGQRGEAWQRAVANICHAVMNSASFIYVD